MNHEQLIEAVRNLLTIREFDTWDRHTCDQCNEHKQARFGTVGGELVCSDCIKTHARLVLDYAESCRAADAH